MIVCFRLILILVTFHFQSFVINPFSKNTTIKADTLNELTSFEAISDGKKVIVNWTSGTEINFDYYTVEKSKDGIHFYSALMIKSAGKLAGTFEYTDVDYSPFSGISYYRLRRNDYFGEFSYSSMVAVNCQILKDGTIVPVSMNSTVQQEIQSMQGKPVLVIMRDNKGEEFVSKIVVSHEAEKLYARDVKNQLSAGEYYVVASSCNPLYHQKVSVK